MKIRKEDGKLIIDPWEIFQELDEVEIQNLADDLSCNEFLIKNVADQIIDGWTEGVRHGARDMRPKSSPSTALDDAIRRISKASSSIAAKEIERLEGELERQSRKAERYREWCVGAIQ